MSSRSRTVVAGHPARARRRSRSRGGLLSLSEKQTQAYLAARDVIRRILQTSTLVLPPRVAGPMNATPVGTDGASSAGKASKPARCRVNSRLPCGPVPDPRS